MASVFEPLESDSAAKEALRGPLRAARLARSAADRSLAAQQIAEHVLGLPEVAAARACAGSVAAYVSVAGEPDTADLLDRLRGTGVEVLLPVLLDDLDLDWAAYVGAGELVPSAVRPRLLEPAGPRLGVAAVAAASLILVPALAVGADGTRLGQGGGSYDRALSRVPPGVPVAALVFDGELVASVPAQAHDRPVRLAVTAAGVLRF
jgi:5-formyltetrahydrofolate cyclo-ligase